MLALNKVCFSLFLLATFNLYSQELRNNFFEEGLRERILFLNQYENYCEIRSIALKTSYIAKKNHYYKTSELILRKLLECSDDDLLVYSELLELYKETNNFDKVVSLNKFARNKLSNEKYTKFEISRSKYFSKSYFKYNYEISTLYSSNINNGISAETIELFGFPFSTSKDSKPKSGIGLNLDINYEYNIPTKNGYDKFISFINVKDFPSSIGDNSFLYVGYVRNSQIENLNFNIYSSSRLFAGENVLTSTGIDSHLRLKRKFFKKIIIGIRDDNYLANFQSGTSLKAQIIFDSFLSNYNFSYEDFNANQDTYSFQRYSLNFKKWEFNDLDLRFFISKSIYEENFFIFNKTRGDQTYSLSVRKNNPIFNSYQVSLDITRIDSNITIFDSESISVSFKRNY